MYTAARKKGIDITKQQAQEVASKSVRQIFAPQPRSDGKIASRAPRAKLQADLVDFKQTDAKENDGYRAVLLASEVFSRKLYAEPLKSKAPKEVLEAFNKILARTGPVERVDTDQGQEWQLVERKLKDGNIGYTVRESINALGVLDSAMGTWKAALSRKMADGNTARWVDKVKSTTDAFNSTPHGALRGDEPDEVEEKPVVKFHAYQDNARRIDQNIKASAGKRTKLAETGAFRTLLPKSSWVRATQPKWSSEVHKLEDVQGSSVKSTQGKTFHISKVLPVDPESKDFPVPASIARGSAARDLNTRRDLEPFAARLKAYLAGGTNGARSLTEVARHAKTLAGWELAMAKHRLNRPGGLQQALRLLNFEVFGPAGPGQRKVRSKRMRLRGKQ